MLIDKAALCVRPFETEDVPQLLDLMRALAVFEGYADDFAVTEADLIGFGLGPDPRFGAFVAAVGGRLVGMAVHYRIPWTYDLKPTLVLKELFVLQEARGLGVGRALLAAVVQEAERIEAPRLKWTVLPDNEDAKRFYRSEGGRMERDWEPWIMTIGEPRSANSLSAVI